MAYIETLNGLDIAPKAYIRSVIAPICFMGRLLDRFGYEGGTQTLYGQSVAYDGAYYYSCGSYNSNANQCIAKHDSTGAIVASASYTELYHAGSLTILDGKIYVATQNGPYVAVVNQSTLAYESTLTLTGASIANVFALSAYDGALYARCRDSQYNEYVYSVNVTSGACTLVCSMGSFVNRVNQGFCYAGDVAYCVNNDRSAIFEIDTKTGSIIRTYNLPDGDSQYPLGEPEDLLMVGSSLVLSCAEYFNEMAQQKASIVYLFKTGIGEAVQSDITEAQSISHVSLTVNGNGTTEFAPYRTFNTVEEACVIANYAHGATITASNLSTGYAALVDGKYAINGTGGTQTVSRLYIRNATTNTRAIQTDSTYVENSELYAFNCTIGSIQALFSHLMFNDLTILAGSTLDYRYCDIRYLNLITCASDVVGYTDSASRLYNRVSIDTHGNSTYLANLLRCLNRRVGMTLWFTGHTIGGGITVGNFSSESFTINTGDSSYPKIGYANGSFYILDSNSSQTNLSDGFIVRIEG